MQRWENFVLCRKRDPRGNFLDELMAILRQPHLALKFPPSSVGFLGNRRSVPTTIPVQGQEGGEVGSARSRRMVGAPPPKLEKFGLTRRFPVAKSFPSGPPQC